MLVVKSRMWLSLDELVESGERSKNPRPRIPPCGHLQVQAGRRMTRLKQVGSQVTQK